MKLRSLSRVRVDYKLNVVNQVYFLYCDLLYILMGFRFVYKR